MFGFRKKHKFKVGAQNESIMRTILNDAGKASYNRRENFNKAKADQSGYAVMEGDYGGQVYLSVPMQLVTCDEKSLQKLLHEVDSLGWNDPEGATLYYESISPGQGIPGGMGGGLAEKGLWVHKELAAKKQTIENYLAGKIDTII